MTNDTDSHDPARDPDTQPRSQLPIVPPTAPAQHEVAANPDERPEEQQETARELAREFRWVEFGQLIVNGALAIIGVIALYIYNGQLDEMRKSTKATETAATAAASAALTAHNTLVSSQEQFRADHRPYVFIGLATGKSAPPAAIEKKIENSEPVGTEVAVFFDGPRYGIAPQSNVSFTNYGTSPAIRAQMECRVTYGKNARNEVRKLEYKKDIATGILTPGDTRFKTCFATSIPKHDATVDELKDAWTVHGHLVVFGNIRYFDIWDNSPTYETEFCYQVEPQPLITKGPVPAITADCGMHGRVK